MEVTGSSSSSGLVPITPQTAPASAPPPSKNSKGLGDTVSLSAASSASFSSTSASFTLGSGNKVSFNAAGTISYDGRTLAISKDTLTGSGAKDLTLQVSSTNSKVLNVYEEGGASYQINLVDGKKLVLLRNHLRVTWILCTSIQEVQLLQPLPAPPEQTLF